MKSSKRKRTAETALKLFNLRAQKKPGYKLKKENVESGGNSGRCKADLKLGGSKMWVFKPIFVLQNSALTLVKGVPILWSIERCVALIVRSHT